MRRAIQGVMGVVLAAAVPAGAAAQAREASDDNDRSVHAFVSAVDLGEVQQSMLAMERAANPEVRSFAQRMIADHGNALHTREMLMQTENSGLMGGMAHGAHGGHAMGAGGGHAGHGGTAGSDASRNQGPLPPAYGPGNGGNASGGNVPQGQRTTSTAPAGDNTRAGQLPPAYGPGNGQVNVEQGSAQAMGNGQGGGNGMAMAGMPPGVTPAMVRELEGVLAAHPMARPVMESNARNLQVLQGIAAGPQFDASYMDAQIAGHRYALTSIDRMLAQQGTLGDDITGSLRMMRTAVAAHLEMAQQIRARLQ